MKVKLQIDPSIDELSVIVEASQLTPEVERLYQVISEQGHTSKARMLIGYKDDQAIPLNLAHVIRLYTEDHQVWAETTEGIMRVRMRIKELEGVLASQGFVKINQGEIINIAFIKRMDLSIAGSVAVRLSTGSSCFVSRRQLKAFKDVMGL